MKVSIYIPLVCPSSTSSLIVNGRIFLTLIGKIIEIRQLFSFYVCVKSFLNPYFSDNAEIKNYSLYKFLSYEILVVKNYAECRLNIDELKIPLLC